ncbi:MAG: hypothetical protein VKM17_04890 [Cyanobacteriota bacterium]|nr:hypothetical protein [Cyanobacteriota bacterium]
MDRETAMDRETVMERDGEVSASLPWPAPGGASCFRRPLVKGLALALGWLVAPGLLPLPARASSPEAWKAYDQEVRQACLKASALKPARVMGQRVDVPELSMSVLLMAGRPPQAPLAGQTGKELCLFTQAGRRAVVVGADALDQPRWPYPAPGVLLP